VAVAVVDRLELVDIDEDQDHPAVAATGAVDLVLQGDLSHLAAQRAGEIVVVRVAQIDRSAFAIARRPGPVRGRGRAIGRGLRAILRGPRAHLGKSAFCLLPRAGAQGIGLERLGGAIALRRRLVAGLRAEVAQTGGVATLVRRPCAVCRRCETLIGGLVTIGPCDIVADRFAGGCGAVTICRDLVEVGRPLISIRVVLIPVREALVAVGSRLIAVGHRLIRIGQGLVD
jgi:hypothetical protein